MDLNRLPYLYLIQLKKNHTIEHVEHVEYLQAFRMLCCKLQPVIDRVMFVDCGKERKLQKKHITTQGQLSMEIYISKRRKQLRYVEI